MMLACSSDLMEFPSPKLQTVQMARKSRILCFELSWRPCLSFIWGEVLFILFFLGMAYIFAGERYVRGTHARLMQSEAMVMLSSGEVKEQWPDLC